MLDDKRPQIRELTADAPLILDHLSSKAKGHFDTVLAHLDALATSLDHHAVVTLGYRSVRFELWTHDREAITSLDLDFAQGLDEIVVDRFEAFLV